MPGARESTSVFSRGADSALFTRSIAQRDGFSPRIGNQSVDLSPCSLFVNVEINYCSLQHELELRCNGAFIKVFGECIESIDAILHLSSMLLGISHKIPQK